MKNSTILRLERLINNLAAGRWHLAAEGSLNPLLVFIYRN